MLVGGRLLFYLPFLLLYIFESYLQSYVNCVADEKWLKITVIATCMASFIATSFYLECLFKAKHI